MLFLWCVVLIVIILYVFAKITCAHCYCNTCLIGKTALVTGGNSGIGFEVAIKLASRGCRVIIADKDSGEHSKSTIIKKTGNANIVARHVDLASFASIRRFASEIVQNEVRLDYLINNAGVGNTQSKRSEDGLNMTMQVNYFGPVLLTHLLIDLLKKSTPSRIVFTASLMAFIHNLTMDNLNNLHDEHRTFIYFIRNYSNSKAATVIATKYFAEKLRGMGITCNCLHPGLVFTSLFTKTFSVSGISIGTILWALMNRIYAKNVNEGAQTTLHLTLSDKLKDVTGNFFCDCRQLCMPPISRNKIFCKMLIAHTEELIQLTPAEKL